MVYPSTFGQHIWAQSSEPNPQPYGGHDSSSAMHRQSFYLRNVRVRHRLVKFAPVLKFLVYLFAILYLPFEVVRTELQDYKQWLIFSSTTSSNQARLYTGTIIQPSYLHHVWCSRAFSSCSSTRKRPHAPVTDGDGGQCAYIGESLHYAPLFIPYATQWHGSMSALALA